MRLCVLLAIFIGKAGVLAMTGETGLAVQGTQGSDYTESIDLILKQVRQAVFGDKGPIGFKVRGTTNQYKLPSEFVFQQDNKGNYLRTINGRLGQTAGFDGKIAWENDWSGSVRPLELADRDRIHTLNLVQFGGWLCDIPGVTLTLTEEQNDENNIAIELSYDDGFKAAKILVNRKTHLPRRLELPSSINREVVVFSDYRSVDGLTIAYKIQISLGGDKHEESIERLEINEARADFSMPKTSFQNVEFVFNQPLLTTKRAATGHLLVQLTLGDAKDRWFILDSGAGATIVDKVIAKDLKLEPIGKIGLVSMFGQELSGIVPIDMIDLGAIRLKKQFGITMDMGDLAGVMGEKIAGIIGYDLISKCVMQIDLSDDEIRVFDPRAALLHQKNWQVLKLDRKLPLFEAQLNDLPPADYRIDLAASGLFFSNVVFHTPYVNEHDLAKKFGTNEFELPQHKFKTGTIERFEIGGKVFPETQAGFSITDVAPFNEPYSAGNVGVEFLKPFRIVLDYPNHRYSIEKVE